MRHTNLEVEMAHLHHQIHRHKGVRGSILLRDNGLHVSSQVPSIIPHPRKLSAYLAHIWHSLYKNNESSEGSFHLKDQFHVYLKHIPSKKLLLVLFCERKPPLNLRIFINYYSNLFKNLL